MERKQNDLLQSQARTIHLKELENVSERTSTHGFTSCKSPGRKSYTFGDVFVSEVSFRQVTIFVSLKRAFTTHSTKWINFYHQSLTGSLLKISPTAQRNLRISCISILGF